MVYLLAPRYCGYDHNVDLLLDRDKNLRNRWKARFSTVVLNSECAMAANKYVGGQYSVRRVGDRLLLVLSRVLASERLSLSGVYFIHFQALPTRLIIVIIALFPQVAADCCACLIPKIFHPAVVDMA